MGLKLRLIFIGKGYIKEVSPDVKSLEIILLQMDPGCQILGHLRTSTWYKEVPPDMKSLEAILLLALL